MGKQCCLLIPFSWRWRFLFVLELPWPAWVSPVLPCCAILVLSTHSSPVYLRHWYSFLVHLQYCLVVLGPPFDLNGLWRKKDFSDSCTFSRKCPYSGFFHGILVVLVTTKVCPSVCSHQPAISLSSWEHPICPEDFLIVLSVHGVMIACCLFSDSHAIHEGLCYYYHVLMVLSNFWVK